MHQIDSYLDAIRRLLPRDNRADVIAELRDALLTEIEAEQRERGRPLTAAELTSLVSRFGAPRDVASRYGARSYLIGPRIYPVFVFAAKAVAVIIGTIALIRIGVVAYGAEQPLSAIAGVAVRAGLSALVILAIISVLLARVERLPMPALTWTLVPPAPTAGVAPRPAWGTRPVVPRRDTLRSLAGLTFWLVWWTGALPLGDWFLWRWMPVTPAPVVADLSPFVIAVLLTAIAADAIAFVRPGLARMHDAAHVAVSGALFTLIGLALREGPLVIATQAGASADKAADVTNIVMIVCLAGLAAVSLGCAVMTIKGWMRGTPGPGDSSVSARA